MSIYDNALPSDEYVWREIVQYLPDAVDRANLRESCRMLAQLIARPSSTDTTLRQYVERGRDPCMALAYLDANGAQIYEILSFEDAKRNREITARRARIVCTIGFAAVRAPQNVWQHVCAISSCAKSELDMMHVINVLREIWARSRSLRAQPAIIQIEYCNEYEFRIGSARHLFCFNLTTADEFILRAIEFAENMSFAWSELREAIGFPHDTSFELIFVISRALFPSVSELWAIWLQWRREIANQYCASNVQIFRRDRAQLMARKHVRFNENIAFSAQQLRNMRAMHDQRFIRAAIEAIRKGVFCTIEHQLSYDIDMARTVLSIYDWNRTSGSNPWCR